MYQRYANPMELLNMMLMCGRLGKFVREVIETIVEERNEKTQWEFWLHKDWERSWPEFLRAVKSPNDKHEAAPTQHETLDIVKDSMSMMASFRPAGGGVKDESVSSVRGNSD